MKSVLISIAAFACDQLSKWYVYKVMQLEESSPVPVVPPILNFTLAWNHGVNFGMFSSPVPAARWIWVIFALAVSGFVLFHFRKARDMTTVLAAGLLSGGALANGVDRLVYGAVLDFLNFQVFWFHNPYSFNLADVFIFAGALLFIRRTAKSNAAAT